MSDYCTDVYIARDRLAAMLGENEEQMLYVIVGALEGVIADDIIAQGTTPDGVDLVDVAHTLRELAEAVALAAGKQ